MWVSTGAIASPVISIGDAATNCAQRCFIVIPYTINQLNSERQVGMLFCDIKAELSFILAAYGDQINTREMNTSVISAFRKTEGEIKGTIEFDTGIRSDHFKGMKVNSVRCHL